MRLVTGISIVLLAVLVACSPSLEEQSLHREKVSQEILVELPLITPLIFGDLKVGRYAYEKIQLYIPLYMAVACVDGKKPSLEGFKDYTTTTFSPTYWDPNDQLIKTLSKIKRIGAELEEGDKPRHSCMQSFFYPASMADASLAIEVKNAETRSVHRDMGPDIMLQMTHRRAVSWFGQTPKYTTFIEAIHRY